MSGLCRLLGRKLNEPYCESRLAIRNMPLAPTKTFLLDGKVACVSLTMFRIDCATNLQMALHEAHFPGVLANLRNV